MADDIVDLQRAFDEAKLNADLARLEELLAEDFASIGEQGGAMRSAQKRSLCAPSARNMTSAERDS